MGRIKVIIKRIENSNDRNAAFAKRKDAIIKKALELSVLCDTDVAMIMFAPNGSLICFPCNQRVEDVLVRNVSLPDCCRGGSSIPNRESIADHLWEIQRQSDVAARLSRRIEELQREVDRLSEQLQHVEADLWNYEPDIDRITTMEEAESCERFLIHTFNRVQTIKEKLLGGHVAAQIQGIMQLTEESSLLPIDTSMGSHSPIIASESMANEMAHVGHVKQVGPQASESGFNPQSTELLAMFGAPKIPAMEDAMDGGVHVEEPRQPEDGGPGSG